jgi:hypothetical protein
MKFLQWLILSSVDPKSKSLAVKGILLSIIPYVIFLSGFTNIAVPDSDTLVVLADLFASIVQIVLTAVSLIVTLVGIIRKIYMTLEGTNKVLTAQAAGEL